ncbi:hypothetical protein HGRIS_007065 [Hohenbuehelia grisea]|uniref:Uncharacterized protein n=1 Tax=Hohenbuehelia grisea TaxID=104357 RepID=A0ABR3JCJ0_9AGAR
MAFANSRYFNIYGGNFSDVAGDQIIHVTNVTHKYYRVAHGAHATLDLDNDEIALPIPAAPLYSILITTIADIQDALLPLDQIMSETRALGGLQEQLERVRRSAAFTGAIVDILDGVYPEFFLVNVEKHVARYLVVLQTLYGDIMRVRQGLESLLTGPLWRRNLWVSSPPNIPLLVSTTVSEIDRFQKPIMHLITMHKKFFPNYSFSFLPGETQHATWSNSQKAHHFSLRPLKHVSLQYATMISLDGTPLSLPISWCSSWEDLLCIYFRVCSEYHWRIAYDLSWSTYDMTYSARVVLVNVGSHSLNFTQVEPDSHIKLAMASEVVFYKDTPNTCPSCRKFVRPAEQAYVSLIKCQSCGLEYSVRSRESETPPINLDECHTSDPWFLFLSFVCRWAEEPRIF